MLVLLGNNYRFEEYLRVKMSVGSLSAPDQETMRACHEGALRPHNIEDLTPSTSKRCGSKTLKGFSQFMDVTR